MLKVAGPLVLIAAALGAAAAWFYGAEGALPGPSGIRIGTPAMTTRGFKELEAEQLAHMIADVLDAPTDEAVIERVKGEVAKLTAKFPVYG